MKKKYKIIIYIYNIMTHPILITFIISIIITIIYYYFNNNEDDDNDTIYTNCISLFVLCFIIIYLIVTTFGNNLFKKTENNIESVVNEKAYRAPF